jgi:hypothetical protein
MNVVSSRFLRGAFLAMAAFYALFGERAFAATLAFHTWAPTPPMG